MGAKGHAKTEGESESGGHSRERVTAEEMSRRYNSAQKDHSEFARNVLDRLNSGSAKKSPNAEATRRTSGNGDGQGRARGAGSRSERAEANLPKTSQIAPKFKVLRTIPDYELHPNHARDARLALYVFGHRQLRAVLDTRSLETIRDMANLTAYRNQTAPGPASMTRKGLTDYIIRTTTHESRRDIMATIREYHNGGSAHDLLTPHADEAHQRMITTKAAGKSAKTKQPAPPKAPRETAATRNAREIAALHEASGKWQADPANHALPEKIVRGEELADLIPVTANGHLTYGKNGELDVSGLKTLYGEHQLGAALVGYTHTTLKEMATEAGVTNLSGTKVQLRSRITAAATHGHYSANFPKESAAPKSETKASKAAKDHEKQVERAQAKVAEAEKALATAREQDARGGTGYEGYKALAKLRAAQTRLTNLKGEGKAPATKGRTATPEELAKMTPAELRAYAKQLEAGNGGGVKGSKSEQKPLKPILRIGGREIDLGAAPNAHFLRALYGDHQVREALTRYPHNALKETARELGVRVGKNRDETVDNILREVRKVPYQESARLAGADRWNSEQVSPNQPEGGS